MRSVLARALAVALVLQVIGTTPVLAAPASYSIVDLGSPTSYSIAYGLSETGVVVGHIEGSPYEAFRWEAGTREILPALGSTGALARAIDPTGTIIVGESAIDGGGTLAVGWLGTDFGQLGALPGPFTPYSTAFGVNSSLVAAGDAAAGDGTTHAVRWDSDGIADLGGLVSGGNSHARGINELGQITGDADVVPYGEYHAVVWDGAVITDLGTLPGDNHSNGIAINDLGHVVGRSLGRPGGGQFGFFWDGAAVTEMPLHPGGSFVEVHDVNNLDQVVGRGDSADGNGAAFLWEASTGEFTDLNSLLPNGSGWRLDEAFAINDAGQIAGYGIHEGVIRAFLLTPSTDPAGTDYVADVVVAGGSLSTDPGTGATTTDPIVTTVQSPNGGGVLIQEGVFDYPLSEFTILGAQTRIGAPSASPEDPLVIVFTFDASLIPVGEDETTIDVLRYGDVAGECAGASQASPDPCITSRELLVDGDVRITVLTSHASIWSGVVGGVDPFEFAGFFAPIDNLPVYNVVKAGAAVPIRFSLGGDQGLDIFESGSPASRPITCEDGAATDSLELVATPGSTGLTFNAATGVYTYVWKTSTRWTGCRELVVQLSDGTEHVAIFKFRR